MNANPSSDSDAAKKKETKQSEKNYNFKGEDDFEKDYPSIQNLKVEKLPKMTP